MSVKFCSHVLYYLPIYVSIILRLYTVNTLSVGPSYSRTMCVFWYQFSPSTVSENMVTAIDCIKLVCKDWNNAIISKTNWSNCIITICIHTKVRKFWFNNFIPKLFTKIILGNTGDKELYPQFQSLKGSSWNKFLLTPLSPVYSVQVSSS